MKVLIDRSVNVSRSDYSDHLSRGRSTDFLMGRSAGLSIGTDVALAGDAPSGLNTKALSEARAGRSGGSAGRSKVRIASASERLRTPAIRPSSDPITSQSARPVNGSA